MMEANRNNAIPKQATKKKSLRWAVPCSEVESSSSNKITKKEIRRRWYNRKDYMTFRQENKDDAKVLKHCKKTKSFELLQGIIICERGIENNLSKKLRTRRCMRKTKAIFAVLDEQSDQRQFKTFSSDFIAELYQEASAESKEEAYRQGLIDQKDARSYQDEESKQSKPVKLKTFDSKIDPIKPRTPLAYSLGARQSLHLVMAR